MDDITPDDIRRTRQGSRLMQIFILAIGAVIAAICAVSASAQTLTPSGETWICIGLGRAIGDFLTFASASRAAT